MIPKSRDNVNALSVPLQGNCFTFICRAIFFKMAGGHKTKTEKDIEVTEQQRSEIKEAFSVFDSTGSGFIDGKDLKMAMRALGFEPRKDEISDLMKQIGNGRLSMDQFMLLVCMSYIYPNFYHKIIFGI